MARSTNSVHSLLRVLRPGALVLFPIPVFAAATFREAADVLLDVLQGIVLILLLSMGVGLVYSLFWYFSHGENPEAREKYRRYMLWSIIGVIVTFGLWGILGLFTTPAIPVIV